MKAKGINTYMDKIYEAFPDMDKKSITYIYRYFFGRLDRAIRSGEDVWIYDKNGLDLMFTVSGKSRHYLRNRAIKKRIRQLRYKYTGEPNVWFYGLNKKNRELLAEGNDVEVILYKVEQECKLFFKEYHRIEVEDQEQYRMKHIIHASTE